MMKKRFSLHSPEPVRLLRISPEGYHRYRDEYQMPATHVSDPVRLEKLLRRGIFDNLI